LGWPGTPRKRCEDIFAQERMTNKLQFVEAILFVLIIREGIRTSEAMVSMYVSG